MYLCSSGCIGLLWRHKQQTTTTTLYMDYIYEKFLFFFLCIDALFFFLSPKEATRLFFYSLNVHCICTVYMKALKKRFLHPVQQMSRSTVPISCASFFAIFFCLMLFLYIFFPHRTPEGCNLFLLSSQLNITCFSPTHLLYYV